MSFEIDKNEALYVGDGEDGAYYQIFDYEGCHWVTVMVESSSGGFYHSIIKGGGPYESKEEAYRTGRAAAYEWCHCNGVTVDD